jgi:iron(III) transport system substrate-binding protein
MSRVKKGRIAVHKKPVLGAIFVASLAAAAITGPLQGSALAEVVTFKAQPVPTPDVGTPELVKITPELIAAAKAEGEMNLMYSGQQGTSEAIATAFANEYGIKVNFDRKVGAAGTQAFSTQERAGRHVTDVYVTTDGAGFLPLISEGLVANYTLDAERPPLTRIDGWAYAPQYQNVVNSYNSKLLPLADAKRLLTDWNNVLDPSLANGKIGLLKPTSATQSFLLFWMWLTTPELGTDFAQKLAAQKPVFFQGSGPAREALAAGEITVLLGDNGANTTEEFMKGADLNFQWPSLGPHWASSFNAISAHAPHPNVARLYVAWLLGDEGAHAIAAANETPTLTSASDLPTEATSVLEKTDWWTGPFPKGTEWDFDKYEFFNPDFVKELVVKVDEIFGISG